MLFCIRKETLSDILWMSTFEIARTLVVSKKTSSLHPWIGLRMKLGKSARLTFCLKVRTFLVKSEPITRVADKLLLIWSLSGIISLLGQFVGWQRTRTMDTNFLFSAPWVLIFSDKANICRYMWYTDDNQCFSNNKSGF